jgi:sulfane dehydrogenase subunit SoxC
MADTGSAGTRGARPVGDLDERIAREAQALAAKCEDPASPYYRDPSSGRRRFLRRSAGALGAGGGWIATAFAQAPLGAVHDVPPDASKTQGYPLADESYGTRSQFETEVRRRFKTATQQSSWTMTPLEHGCGIVTASGLHFERSHGGTAVIDPAMHSLYVHGMVRAPKKFSMKDIRRFPSKVMMPNRNGFVPDRRPERFPSAASTIHQSLAIAPATK